ncbi:MBL fold metallo-hydrolase [Nocardiopsis sp. HNM0947]|uniref:MBL fold metallo-hydrolase n=1 Tax=Nocardiopsis coralli TaxID=2772213 RepID=A0ABR9P685_9ACTN|nr:MBL fold metallo-hydrolase [Nocardiopsis coralli]MBE2999352.1 MBL fold metallo-hydrolase [Nocardiopsis coralli]
MFWKRKSKKKDGQEATGSAAEAAGSAEEVEEAEETASEDRSEKAGSKDGADKAGDGEKETASDEGETEETASDESAEDSDDEEAGDEKDPEDAAAEEPASTDVFADEGEETGVTGPDSEGITRVRTAGTFEFDGEKFEMVANTWIVDADEDGVIVIDPAYDSEAILEAVGERDIYLVACTNGYSPHIAAAIAVAEEAEAPIALHPREMRVWRRYHGAEHRPEIEVEGQGSLDVGDLHIDVLALPGTSTGTVGYSISQKGVVFSGDTVRSGEPGMVGDTYLDYTTQLASIGEKLLSLPPETRLLPDRGPATTTAAEGRNFDSWV